MADIPALTRGIELFGLSHFCPAAARLVSARLCHHYGIDEAYEF
jgi:hypothetical protein